MKRIYQLLLLASIFCSTILPTESTLTPDNTEIIFDIDDVLIRHMGYGIYPIKLVLGGIAQNPLNAIGYISALLNVVQAFVEDNNGNRFMRDENGNKINGLTIQLLYQGMRDPQLTPYVAWLIETIEESRWFIPGTIKIVTYLKEKKGYTINFATNKDHVSYNLTTQTFGDKFANIPTKVFVAHPGNNSDVLAQIKKFTNQSTTPTSYKNLAYTFFTTQPTTTVFHTPGKKPDLDYYQYVEKTIGADKNLIFIDDQKPNSDGFNKLQETTTKLRYGIHFKDPIQLANELIKLGILSETDDKQLLDEIGYSWSMRMRKYAKGATI